jgi:IclR family transcriptional regulator, acetate operon repressor
MPTIKVFFLRAFQKEAAMMRAIGGLTLGVSNSGGRMANRIGDDPLRSEESGVENSMENQRLDPDPDDEDFNLAFAARVLDVVGKSKEPSLFAQICRSAQLPRSTVFRVLTVLEQAGLIGKHADGRHFGKAQELSSWAREALLATSTKPSRRHVLAALVEEVGFTCNLTIPNGNSMMYLDRIERRWPLPSSMHPGALLPLYASACGKLFLTYMPLAARNRFVKHCPLVQITGKTLTNTDALKAELERIREAGYSLDNEEYLPGICCLAVPVYNIAGKLVASVAMHWPTAEQSVEKAESRLPALKAAAVKIGATIDW